ncbi:hypothetical protein CKAH01_03665 [Colletotrichum kahawae]|uniref:Uncharacterized protein n=1 Tax=Colletotrichum kahawae TaxID=34407 RepID=A0AAD9YQJ8_COLKA|nr:hypothetical protein CKAH01_03665 [Colletotrichum kahawae]
MYPSRGTRGLHYHEHAGGERGELPRLGLMGGWVVRDLVFAPVGFYTFVYFVRDEANSKPSGLGSPWRFVRGPVEGDETGKFRYACLERRPIININNSKLSTWNVANGCIFVPRNATRRARRSQGIGQEPTERLALAVASKSGISKLVLRVNDRPGIQVAGTETTPDVEMTRQYQLQQQQQRWLARQKDLVLSSQWKFGVQCGTI